MRRESDLGRGISGSQGPDAVQGPEPLTEAERARVLEVVQVISGGLDWVERNLLGREPAGQILVPETAAVAEEAGGPRLDVIPGGPKPPVGKPPENPKE